MALKKNIIQILVTAVVFSGLLSACNSSGGGSTASDSPETKDVSSTEDSVVRPSGWTEKTHGNKADPDYSTVFPDNAVGRIDISISSADWQAMMTDENLVSAFGSFGSKAGSSPATAPSSTQPGGNIGGNTPPTGFTPPDGASMPPGTAPSDGSTPPVTGLTTQDGTQSVPADAVQGATPADNMLEMSANPEWKQCTFVCNGLTWNHVGIRFKGNSSLSSTWSRGVYKLPLRFEFDQFEDDYPEIEDQRFYGFKTLSMSSGYNDDSLVREKVATDIFRNLGVPAPKAAFYRVYIDCGDGSGAKYFGLYTMVEVPDKPMLNAYFGNKNGNLYKPSGTTATFGSGTPSVDDFDKENNEDEADYSDVITLYNSINDSTTDSATWKSNLEKVFDVDGFLRWLAVNTVIQNWDTYGVMAHNYYLYNNNNKLTWIPWDNNESLKGSNGSSSNGNTNMAGKMGMNTLSLALNESSLSSWPLISRIIAQPDYKAIYQSYVKSSVEDYFNVSVMQPVFEKYHALIYDYVAGTQGEQDGYTLLSSKDSFINSLNALNTHVADRVTAVADYLNTGN